MSSPEKIHPWKVNYARWDGGSLHATKGANSGWEAYLEDPDLLAASVNLYDARTVALLKRMHVNWVYVTWSVGFSLARERRAQHTLAKYIAACHEHGIRATAYLSIANVFTQEILQHEPEIVSYQAIDWRGAWLTYGDGASFRGRPRRNVCCVLHHGWRSRVTANAVAAIGAGADAVYFDNAVEGCVCDSCRELFPQYAARFWGGAEPMPVLRPCWEESVVAEANQQGQEAEEPAASFDPAGTRRVQMVRQFEKWKYDGLLAEVAAAVRRVSPAAFVYRNSNLGVDAFRCAPASVIITENANEPGLVEAEPPIVEGYSVFRDGTGEPRPIPHLAHVYRPRRTVNNLGLYQYLLAAGGYSKPVRAEPQGRADGTQSRYVPPTTRRAKLAVAEAAACNVDLAPHMDGGALKEMCVGTEFGGKLADAYGCYHRFLLEHELLYTRPSFPYDVLVVINDNTHAAEWLNRLAERGVLFNVGFPDELTAERLSRKKVVIVPDYFEWFPRKRRHFMPYTSTDFLEALRQFISGGGTAFVPPHFGEFDEHLRPRSDTSLRDQLLRTPGVRMYGGVGEDLPDNRQFLHDLSAARAPAVRAELPSGVLMVWTVVPDGSTIVHLLNYASVPSGPVTVSFVNPKNRFQAFSPDGVLDVQSIDSEKVRVQSVDIYAVLRAVDPAVCFPCCTPQR